MDIIKKNNLIKVLTLLGSFMVLLFVSSLIANVILGNKILQFSLLLVCVFSIPAIVMKPIRGLLLLPIVTYMVPYELKFNGISLGLALSGITILSSLNYVISGKTKPNFSWIQLPIVLMFILKIWFSGNDNKDIINFIQGITPFLIFSLAVREEYEGRLILKYWCASFAMFAFFHLLRGGLLFSDDSILQGMASVRTQELGGYNPNVLGWMSLLYISISAALAMSAKNNANKKRWWLVFGGILLLIIFSFSRAAMVGLVGTLFLLLIFIGSKIRNYSKLLIPLTISILSLTTITALFISYGLMDSSRTLSYESIAPEIGVRLAMIFGGWSFIFENPWGYGADFKYSSHSAFTKAALNYGIPYLFLFCIPFIHLIRKSYTLSKRLKDPSLSFILSGICAAGIIAVPQSIFGGTLFDAGYAQIFWLFLGYLQLFNKNK